MGMRSNLFVVTLLASTIHSQVVIRDSVEIAGATKARLSSQSTSKVSSSSQNAQAYVSSKIISYSVEGAFCGWHSWVFQVPLAVVEILPDNIGYGIESCIDWSNRDKFIEGDDEFWDGIRYQINGTKAEFYTAHKWDSIKVVKIGSCPNPDWISGKPDPYCVVNCPCLVPQDITCPCPMTAYPETICPCPAPELGFGSASFPFRYYWTPSSDCNWNPYVPCVLWCKPNPPDLIDLGFNYMDITLATPQIATISPYNYRIEWPSKGVTILVWSQINLAMSMSPDTVRHGESAETSFAFENLRNGDPVDMSDDVPITLFLWQPQEYGHLIGPDGTPLTNIIRPEDGSSETTLNITSGYLKSHSIQFIADGIEPDSTAVIAIDAYGPSEEFSNISGSVSGVVAAQEDSVDHFSVTISPDTVYHGEKATLEIIPKDENDQPVGIGDDVSLKIDLDDPGAKYGTLLAGELEGKFFESISFGEVKDHKLLYIADGDNPLTIDCCAPEIKVSVSLAANAGVKGEDGAWVHCKNSPPRYEQGGTATWADSVYDHVTGKDNKIRNQGCALSCLSMVMTAFGDTIDPGQLNTWMKAKEKDDTEAGGYTFSGGVSWHAPREHSNNKLSIDWDNYDDPKDMIIKKEKIIPATDSSAADTTIENVINHEESFSKSVLDGPLSKCELVIVQVYNNKSSGKGYHWVLVYGKEEGKYLILDPGSREEKYLDGYENGEFWKYFSYKKTI